MRIPFHERTDLGAEPDQKSEERQAEKKLELEATEQQLNAAMEERGATVVDPSVGSLLLGRRILPAGQGSVSDCVELRHDSQPRIIG